MKIVHFSDWHTNFYKLPEADLYVCTGDMLPDFFIYPGYKKGMSQLEKYMRRELDNEGAKQKQLEWFYKNYKSKGESFRKYLGTKNAPVVIVRGNHDFTDLGPMFGGDYFEVTLDSNRSREYKGLRVGGMRGVPFFGNWSDNFRYEQLRDMVEGLPNDLDVVITHAPPKGILDMAYNKSIGIEPLTSWITKSLYTNTLPKLFCYGHVHECFGTTSNNIKNTLFSNAARSHTEIYIT